MALVVAAGTLASVGFGTAALAGSSGPSATVLPRATTDRPDDFAGPQARLMYVLPSDAQDRAFDTDGTIAGSAASFQAWLAAQTAGQALRLDTSGGVLDIGFFRLSKTDAEVAARGAFVRDEVEAQLKAAGYTAPGKIYGVYYDGSSSFACGGGAWPPALPGTVGALYLKGAPPGYPPCSGNAFSNGGAPGYWEFSLVHELFHTIGIVGTCAPNHTRAGHVSDDNRDLMYAGDQPWQPSILDVGRNDYYGHSLPGCVDIATAGYLGPYTPATTATTATATTATTTSSTTTSIPTATQVATTTNTTTTTQTTKAVGDSRPTVLSIARLNITPRRPRAGGILTARATLRGALIGARVACRANVGQRRLRASVYQTRGSIAVCAWRVPRGTRGGTFTASMTVIANGTSIIRRFALRIA